MRCHICNSILETPKFNSRYDEFDPCPKCLSEINEVFDDYVEEEIEEDVELEPLDENFLYNQLLIN